MFNHGNSVNDVKSEIAALLKKLHTFVESNPKIDEIPLKLNSSMTNEMFIKEIKAIKPEYDVCHEKIERGKLIEDFDSGGKPVVSVFLKHNADIIGVCVFHFTNRPAKSTFGMKINKTKLYIRINWLCGSKYKGVGSHIMNVLKKLKEELGIVSIHLISYESAIPFYKKVGMQYIGNSNFRTPIMEL